MTDQGLTAAIENRVSSGKSSVSDRPAQQSSTTSNKLLTFIVATALVSIASVILALPYRNLLFPSVFHASKRSIALSVAGLNPTSPIVVATAMLDEKPVSAKLDADIGAPTGNRTPVYFFSHGGPTFMYSDRDEDGGDLGAFKMLRKIGKEIVEKVRPKAVVVFSAHWQASEDQVEVNTSEISDLIYDFYGFPSFMYEEQFPNVGSRAVAQRVIDQLQSKGIKAKGVSRGIDHGVWVPFKITFPEFQALKVPIVQVSLFGTDNPNQHVALGKALAPLRDENILIICSGMTVHNLREMGKYWGSVAPYSKRFDDTLERAISTQVGTAREDALANLIETNDANKSHPTKEHLLPIYIAAGAAYNEKGERLYTNQTSSLAWGEYRFGSLINA
ncbi:Extradiol ring-cleavage dioxygenase, class III enzyme, subunit B [Lipomyces orientalis]|uniref:Extradiol ring-cleavage dioxygenase, class III enzyme, subunit B n=1 Tax=Lipomyces orientalis TaxID=1233043 RepID=A0ACC3TEJ6_9ASCO